MIWVILLLGITQGIAFYFNESWDRFGNDVLALVNASDNVYAQSTSNPYWVNGTFHLPIYSLSQVGDVYAGCEFSGVRTGWFFFVRNVSLDWYNRSSGQWQSVCSIFTFLTTSDRWLVCNVTRQYEYDILNFQTIDGTTTYFRCNINGGFGTGRVRIDRLAAAAYAHICTNLTISAYYYMEYDLYGSTINVTNPYPGKACINIQTSNVVLDCRNHTISGVNYPAVTYGVLANNVTNVTLVNCNITNYTYNAFFNDYTTDVKVFNSSFDLAENASLVVNWYTREVWIENNTFNNSPKGIWFMNEVQDVLVFNNTFFQDNTGILAYNTQNTNITFNRFLRTNIGINASLLNNATLHSNFYQTSQGILLYNSENITSRNETFSTDITSYNVLDSQHLLLDNWTISSELGIYIQNTNNTTISNGYSRTLAAFLDALNLTNSQIYNVWAEGSRKFGARLQRSTNILINNISFLGAPADYGVISDSSHNITLNNTSITSVTEGVYLNWATEQFIFNSQIFGFNNYGIRYVNNVWGGLVENVSVYSGGASSIGVGGFSSGNISINNITITAVQTGAALTQTQNISLNHSQLFSIIGSCIYLEGVNYFAVDFSQVFDCYRALESQSSTDVYSSNNLIYNNVQGYWINNTNRTFSRDNILYNNQELQCNFLNSITARISDRLFNSSLGCGAENTTDFKIRQSYFFNHTLGVTSWNSTIELINTLMENGSIGLDVNLTTLTFNNLTLNYTLGVYGTYSNLTSNLLNIIALTGVYWWYGSADVNTTNISSDLGFGLFNSTTSFNGGDSSIIAKGSSLILENSTFLNITTEHSSLYGSNLTSDFLDVRDSSAILRDSFVLENPTYNSTLDYFNVKGTNVSLLFTRGGNINTSVYTGASLGMSVLYGNNTMVDRNAIENNSQGLFLVNYPARNKWFGINYVDWNNAFPLENVSKDVERMKWLGIDRVNLAVQLIQTDNTSSDVQIKPGTSLAHLSNVVSYIRSQGLKVCIYPLLSTSTGQWRGTIRPTDLATWFNNYQTIMNNLASLSPDCLYVGSEYVALQNESAYWQNIVNSLSTYPGELYYGFNWYDALYRRSYENLSWILSLDGLGLSFYAPLASCTDPFDLALFSNNIDTNLYPRIELMHNNTTLPIFFSEVGYRSTNNAYCRPYDWSYNNNLQNLTRQALLHELIINKTHSWPDWFKGEIIWYYESPGIYRWDGYGVIDKEAEYKIREIITGGPALNGNLRMIDEGDQRNMLFVYQWMIRTQNGIQTHASQYIFYSWWAMLERPVGVFSLNYVDTGGRNVVLDLRVENNTSWILDWSIDGVPQPSLYIGPFTPGIHRYGIEIKVTDAYVWIDNIVRSFIVPQPSTFQGFGVVSSWNNNDIASITLYNATLMLENPDTNQRYVAYRADFLGGVRGWMYYSETEPMDPYSGTLLLLPSLEGNKVEKQSLGINQPTQISFYNNSICFNTFDVYSTFNYTLGVLDRCDLFANWWENGRPGCARTCSRVWNYLYGKVNHSLILAAQGDTTYLGEWPSYFENGTVFVVDYDSNIHWDRLVGLTRDSTNTFVPGNNDFAQADAALFLNTFPLHERIVTKWGGGSASVPLATQTFNIMGNLVSGVPVASSAPGSTSFRTGILWDSFYNTQYTGAEPLVFATTIAQNTTDLYGQYDYLISVPYTLSMLEGVNDLVAIYVYVE